MTYRLELRRSGDLPHARERLAPPPISLRYQPLISFTDTGYKMRGFEVIIRFGDGQSFDVATYETELRNDDGHRMLVDTLNQLKLDSLHHDLLNSVPCTVNISPRQLTRKNYLLLRRCVKMSPQPIIEILEDARLSEKQIRWLRSLHDLGLKIWIDDLPTKFSIENTKMLIATNINILSGVKIANPECITQDVLELLHEILEKHPNPKDFSLVVEYIETTEKMRDSLKPLIEKGLIQLINDGLIIMQGYVARPARAEEIKSVLDSLSTNKNYRRSPRRNEVVANPGTTGADTTDAAGANSNLQKRITTKKGRRRFDR